VERFQFALYAQRITLYASVSSQLQVIQLHRGWPAEQAHGHSHLSFVRHHLFHRTIEVGEWTFRDCYGLPDEEWNLLLRLLLLRFVGNAEEAVDFVRTQRLRKALVVTDELDHALNRIDDVRRLLIHYHLDEHVPRIQLPLDRHLLAVLDLDHFLRRHECLPNLPIFGRARVDLDLPLNQRTDLVLVA